MTITETDMAITEKFIEVLLDKVEWEVVDEPAEKNSDLPYATHSGVLKLLGYEFRCYQLSDGRRGFHADDVQRFCDLPLSD